MLTMNTKLSLRSFQVVLLIALPAFFIASCKIGTTNNEAENEDCKSDLIVSKVQTLHSNDTGNARFFYLPTKPSRSGCEANYDFTFGWANPDSSAKSERMPPLDDLTHAFAPGGLQGLFSYFGHDVPVKDRLSNIWRVTFSVGNKTAASDTTIYTVNASLKNGTPLADSVQILCTIRSTSFKK